MTTNSERVCLVLEDVFEHVLSILHTIQKNLRFWESIAERSHAMKVYFMVFERGLWAFINETYKFLCGTAASSLSVSDYVNENLIILCSLRGLLATFLVEFYMGIDNIGEESLKSAENKLPSLIVLINELFSALEDSS